MQLFLEEAEENMTPRGGARITVSDATSWKTLARGLDYSETTRRGWFGGTQRIIALRLDLEAYRPRILRASDIGKERALVESLATHHRLPLAVNGGFFSLHPTRSLGLLVDRGTQLNPLRRADWGVLYVAGRRAALVHTRDYRAPRGVEFAIQCGPRLVIDGVVPKLKPQRARRTALGIQGSRRLVLAVSQAPLDISELARLFAATESAGGFGCRQALNLDGGSSTQIYCKLGTFRRIWHQHVPVTNAVAFEPRQPATRSAR